MTGPDRTKTYTKTARMRTTPLPPHLKKKVLASIANAELLRAAAAPVEPSVVDGHTVGAPTPESPTLGFPATNFPPTQTPEVDVSQTFSPSGFMDPNIVAAVEHMSAATTLHSNDSTSDGGSYTSTISDVFNMDLDYSEFVATGPWVAMDHLTGEIIVHDDATITVPPSGQTGMETAMLPRLNTHVLAETEPPTLLLADEDVRPNWLISAVKEFLRYTPYYGCLGKVIDQFLLQEARLGYPTLVSYVITYQYSHTDTIQSVRQALPSNNRPTEVGQFQKWARKYSRGDNVDTERFGAAVIQWWLTIQPTARKHWPPTYGPLPDDFSFEYFNRGGPNGVFLMILCLGWWANALTADANMIDYMLLVDDVSWVLENLARQAA